MGALITKKACLNCHAKQGYKLGDIRGGISIYLNADEYKQILSAIDNRAFRAKLIFTSLIILLTILIHKQIRQNQTLNQEVQNQTQEINKTKNILQHVIDADKSFLFVLDDTKMILANKTMLDFFGYQTIEQFSQEHPYISDLFEDDKSELYLRHFMEDKHWINYLCSEQSSKDLKVKLKNNDNNIKIFKPSTKDIHIDNQVLHIVIFDDITDKLQQIEEIKEEASIDSLTHIFNRGKYEEILSQEIKLAESMHQPLSAIFIDIDHFKNINDTFGHTTGDKVLISLAKILHENMRLNDSVSRWGGEEFIILLQSTPVNEAFKIAEKLKNKVSDHNFDDIGYLTVSLGVTEYIYGEDKESFIDRVDKALYEAKNTGRDKVIQK
jgi:diguanylate cyclase (GGDEF)-like protein